jgi:YHS domain-containing protein
MRTFKTFTFVSLCFFVFFFAAGVAFAAQQTTCPVMGATVNKNIHADYKGERVYFCCMGCPGPFAKDPEKYINKMKAMGQEPEKIGQNN